MKTFISVIVVYFLILIYVLYSSTKPSKKIISKYGIPLHHFSGMKCWHTLPVKGSSISMDFYPDKIIVSECINEFILYKDFENYKFYGSYFNLVFEFTIDGIKRQMTLTRKQQKLLENFFNCESD